MNAASEYQFRGWFSSAKTVQKAYDDADLARPIQAYKFFGRRCRSRRPGTATRAA